LATYFTPQGLTVNLIWPAGHVPRVLDEHVRTLSTVCRKKWASNQELEPPSGSKTKATTLY
jgi:hypothetical protein